MRNKYTAMIAAVVLGLAVTLLAAEKQSGRSEARSVRLKSNGETVAELRIPRGASISISGKNIHSYAIEERTIAKGDVTIEIRHAGGPSVVVKADEIEAVGRTN